MKSRRSGTISKYYAWLEANNETPIEIRMLILDNCLFSSILYGIENWGNFECIYETLRSIVLKALKAALNVKKGTPKELIYHKIRRPDIVSRVKDAQFNFFQRISKIAQNEALIKDVMILCDGSLTMQYYKKLHNHHRQDDIQDRERLIRNSNSSMVSYYANMNFVDKSVIYNSYMCEKYHYSMAIIKSSS